MVNKKGWIRIVEAFFAVLLVVGVLIIIVSQFFVIKDVDVGVYELEETILKGISLNSSLREYIFVPDSDDLPFNASELEDVNNYIMSKIPINLDYEAVICEKDAICEMFKVVDEDIYARSILISAESGSGFEIRKLKLFCWPV